MRAAAALSLVLLAWSGCGQEEEEPAAARAAAPAPAGTATPTPTPPPAARSASECAELWNSSTRPGTAGQYSPVDFLVEVARSGDPGIVVTTNRRDCVIYAGVPGNRREAYAFVATAGRAPWGQPARVDLPRGRVLQVNARATRAGRVELFG